jgi:hypothetical protein
VGKSALVQARRRVSTWQHTKQTDISSQEPNLEYIQIAPQIKREISIPEGNPSEGACLQGVVGKGCLCCCFPKAEIQILGLLRSESDIVCSGFQTPVLQQMELSSHQTGPFRNTF